MNWKQFNSKVKEMEQQYPNGGSVPHRPDKAIDLGPDGRRKNCYRTI